MSDLVRVILVVVAFGLLCFTLGMTVGVRTTARRYRHHVVTTLDRFR